MEMSKSLSNQACNILWLRSITFTALIRRENSHGLSSRYEPIIYFSANFFIISERLWDSWQCVKRGAGVLWLLCCCEYCNITLKVKIPRNVIILYTCCAIMMLMSLATYVILFMEILLFETWCYCKLTLGTECCIVCIWMYVQLM